MKLKKILLGVLAVFTLGIVSIANAPKAFADEPEQVESVLNDYNKLVNYDDLEDIDHSGSYFGSNYKLIPFLEDGIRFEFYFASDNNVHKFSIVFKDYEVIEHDINAKFIEFENNNLGGELYEIKMNYNFYPYGDNENLTLFNYTTEDTEFSQFGEQSFIKNEFHTNRLNIKYFNIYILSDETDEEPGDVITPGDTGTTVPPIVNDAGKVNPIYLYTALGVVVLGVGGYIISLGNKKRKK